MCCSLACLQSLRGCSFAQIHAWTTGPWWAVRSLRWRSVCHTLTSRKCWAPKWWRTGSHLIFVTSLSSTTSFRQSSALGSSMRWVNQNVINAFLFIESESQSWLTLGNEKCWVNSPLSFTALQRRSLNLVHVSAVLFVKDLFHLCPIYAKFSQAVSSFKIFFLTKIL